MPAIKQKQMHMAFASKDSKQMSQDTVDANKHMHKPRHKHTDMQKQKAHTNPSKQYRGGVIQHIANGRRGLTSLKYSGYMHPSLYYNK